MRYSLHGFKKVRWVKYIISGIVFLETCFGGAFFDCMRQNAYAADENLQYLKDTYRATYNFQKEGLQAIRASLKIQQDTVTKNRKDLEGVSDPTLVPKAQELMGKADSLIEQFNKAIAECDTLISQYTNVIQQVENASTEDALNAIVDKTGKPIDARFDTLKDTVYDIEQDANTFTKLYDTFSNQREQDDLAKQLKTTYRQMYRDSYLSQLNDLKKYLGEHRDKITEVRTRLTILFPSLDDPKDQQAAQDLINTTNDLLTAVSDLTRTCDELIGLFNTLISNINTMTVDQLQNIESDNEQLMNSFSDLFSKYYDVYDQIFKFEDKYNEFISLIDSKMNDQAIALGNDIGKIMRELNKIWADLEQAIVMVDNWITQVDAFLVSKADPDPSSSNAMMGRLKALRDQLSAVSKEVQDVIKSYEAIYTKLSGLTDANDIGKINGIKDEIKALETNAQNVKTHYDAAKVVYNAMISDYDAFMAAKRAQLEQKQKEVEQLIDQLYAQLEAMKNQKKQDASFWKTLAMAMFALSAVLMSNPKTYGLGIAVALFAVMCYMMFLNLQGQVDQANPELIAIQFQRAYEKLMEVQLLIPETVFLGTADELSKDLGFDPEFFTKLVGFLDNIQTWLEAMFEDVTQTTTQDAALTPATTNAEAYNTSQISEYQKALLEQIQKEQNYYLPK